MEFYFVDGEEICLYRDGTILRRECRFIERYRQNVENLANSKRWKTEGEGARFLGTAEINGGEVTGAVTGLYALQDGFLYAASVDRSSAIYRSELTADRTAERPTEEHVVNGMNVRYFGGMTDGRKLVCAQEQPDLTADIAVFDLKTNEDMTVTEGDTVDEDPFLCANGDILFASRGVGRDGEGRFVRYSPSEVLRLNADYTDVKTILSSEKYHFCKPTEVNGHLYAIRIPVGKVKSNPLWEIVLFPVRILQAIANFLNTFVNFFTGKSLTSGGANPAKGRKDDSRRLFVRGNLINVQKEYENNRRKKDTDVGFIPRSWQLWDMTEEKPLAEGVADYQVSDDVILYTNGRHVFSLKDGVKTKLCDTENCLIVSSVYREKTSHSIEF